jgi:uncharacterized protein YcbK (DUF882 family)
MELKMDNSLSTFLYFKPREFQCKCGCGLLKYDAEVVVKLDRIRAQLGSPINVLSGCRCAKHNQEENGARQSRHVPENCKAGVADAVDVSCKKALLNKLYELMCKEFKGVGDGRKQGFIHGDLRPLKARWSY